MLKKPIRLNTGLYVSIRSKSQKIRAKNLGTSLFSVKRKLRRKPGKERKE